MTTETPVMLHGTDQLPEPPVFDFRTYLDDIDAVLTTDHARASYGQPVLLHHGTAYGPGDIALDQDTGTHLVAYTKSDPDLLAAATRAGWKIDPPHID